jgi:uracil-DNA glycosylase
MTLFDCYHPSRYNQNTGRLTRDMLAGVFERIETVLHG